MSKISELAEREAAAAEAEQPDASDEPRAGNGDEPDTPGDTTGPAGENPERLMERRLDQLSREEGRHRKRVAEIMGDDFELLIPSPLDFTPGFLFDPSRFPIPPDVKDATLALLGVGGLSDLEEDEERERCPRCNGRGQLRTGSLVPGQDALPCGGCSGAGHRLKAKQPPPPLQPGYPQQPGQMPVQPQQPHGLADSWGRLPGDPSYGLPPFPPFQSGNPNERTA